MENQSHIDRRASFLGSIDREVFKALCYLFFHIDLYLSLQRVFHLFPKNTIQNTLWRTLINSKLRNILAVNLEEIKALWKSLISYGTYSNKTCSQQFPPWLIFNPFKHMNINLSTLDVVWHHLAYTSHGVFWPPSMFYGIHRRETLEPFTRQETRVYGFRWNPTYPLGENRERFTIISQSKKEQSYAPTLFPQYKDIDHVTKM